MKIPEAYLVSHNNKPIPKPLIPLFNLLTNVNLSPVFRWSRAHVPHIVFKYKNEGFSVCFFGRDKLYRVFHPYPNNSETIKHDCSTPKEVHDYIQT